MTLEEAIQHCKEVSESIECNECKAEHEQLTVWLEALEGIAHECVIQGDAEVFSNDVWNILDAVGLIPKESAD